MRLTIPTALPTFGRRQFIKMSLSLIAGSLISNDHLNQLEPQAKASSCLPYGQGLYGQGLYCGLISSEQATLAVVAQTGLFSQIPTFRFESDLGRFNLNENQPEVQVEGIVDAGIYEISLANRAELIAQNIALVGVTCKTQNDIPINNVVVDHNNYTVKIPIELGQHLTCTFLIEAASHTNNEDELAQNTVFLPMIFAQKQDSTQIQGVNNMTRLPVVNNDENNWGTILNEFLLVGHSNEGRLKDVVVVNNVKDFGAIGDGVTDDTLAIQTTLDQGGLVYLPPGNYYVTQTLLITQNHTTLFGAGGGTTDTDQTNTSRISSNSQGYGIAVKNNVQYTTFRDFAIVGQAKTLLDNSQLSNSLANKLRALVLNYDEVENDLSQIHNEIHTTVERVTIESWCTAISSQAASYLLVKDCLIKTMISYCEEGYGITSSTSKAYYLRNRFINTPDDRHGRHAIYVNGPTEDVWVVDNYVYGYDRAPIVSRIVFRDDLTKSGKNYHYLHNKLVSCHYTPHSNSGTISLRCINYNVDSAVTSPGQLENVVVEGNIIQDCGGRGISIDHARQVMIDSNIISQHKESSLIGIPENDDCGNNELEDGNPDNHYSVYHKLDLWSCEDVMIGQISIEVVEAFMGDSTKINGNHIMSGVYIRECKKVSINQVQFTALESSAGLELRDSEQIVIQNFIGDFKKGELNKSRGVFIKNCQNVTIMNLSLPANTQLTNLALIDGASDYITINHVNNLAQIITEELYRVAFDAGHGQFIKLYGLGTLSLADTEIIEWNVLHSQQAEVTLNGSEYTIANPTNLLDGQLYRLFIKQGANKTINWGDAFKFPNGGKPTLSTGTDLITMTCLNQMLYCTVVQDLS